MRIVSLVPSLSSTLVAAGLRDQIVGCTKFCVVPPDLHRTATLVGGTKDPDLDAIARLEPTHILLNEEENKPEHLEGCGKLAKTLATFPKGPADVPQMLRDMHEFLGQGSCLEIAEQVTDLLSACTVDQEAKSFVYLIWKEPYMTVSNDTYIAKSLGLLGWRNLANDPNNRYPAITAEDIKRLDPNLLLLATEPYPFRKRDAQQLVQEFGIPAQSIYRIDGRLTQWYGDLTVPMLEQIRDKKNAGLPAFCEVMLSL